MATIKRTRKSEPRKDESTIETSIEKDPETSDANEAALTAVQLDEVRARLVDERAQLVRRIGERRANLAAATAARPDEGDWAAESMDQGLIARLMDRDVKLLREVEHALGKLAAGSYGVCEATGEPIEWQRLRARPWSRLSLGAKEGRERRERETSAAGGAISDIEALGDDDRDVA
jgi:DnaK suppressor protein